MSHFSNIFKHKMHPLMILGGIVFAVFLAFLFGFFVMLLWNWLMPSIFGLGEIDYWKAWGLVLLCHILFKSGSPGSGHGHGHGHPGMNRKKGEESCIDEFHEGHCGSGWKEHFKEQFHRHHSQSPRKEQEEQGPQEELQKEENRE